MVSITGAAKRMKSRDSRWHADRCQRAVAAVPRCTKNVLTGHAAAASKQASAAAAEAAAATSAAAAASSKRQQQQQQHTNKGSRRAAKGELLGGRGRCHF
jgi:hypothetical protein